MGKRRVAPSVAIMALVVLVMASEARAEIVVGEGAAGVRLGTSKTEVVAKLGQPVRKEAAFWVFPKPCLCSISFSRQQVSAVDVLGKGQRTSKGVGVGTSYEKTTTAYPEAKCYHPPVYGETSRYCVIRSEYKGRSVKTVFAFFEQDLGVRDIEIRFG